MGFKIVEDLPPFEVEVDVVGPGGHVSGSITWRFKAMRWSAWKARLQEAAGQEVEVFLHSLALGWDADAPFSLEAVRELLDVNPGTGNRVIAAYSQGLRESREKN